MSEKRRALGRGLGALIPSGAAAAERPVDVFFRDREEEQPSAWPPVVPNGAPSFVHA